MHWQVKRVERLNIWVAFAQAEREAIGDDLPVVAFRRSHGGWYCALAADALVALLAWKDQSTDPLQTVWDALASLDCDPHGETHNYRARCPAHGGDNPSALHVVEEPTGALSCTASVAAARMGFVHALGLEWGDLFPTGHRSARRVRTQQPRLTGNARRVADTLAALDAAGRPWQAMVGTTCPYCEHPGAWLRAIPGKAPEIDCPDGCNTNTFMQALAGGIAVGGDDVTDPFDASPVPRRAGAKS